MRNQISLFLYILGVVCLVACSGVNERANYNSYPKFPHEIALNAQVIRLDTVFFRFPYRVKIKDHVALVMDLHNTDFYYHAFSYPDWEHITSFGRRGEGPEEMLSAETFHFQSLDSIWALDANKMEFTLWSLSLKEKRAERVECIPIDKELIRVLDFFPVDSGFLTPDYLGEYRYHKVSFQGEPVFSEGQIPSSTKYKEKIKPALAQAWRSFIDYNPGNGVFVMATQLGEVMEIYNLKENSHKVTKGPNGDPLFDVSQGYGIPTGIKGFNDIKVTDNYIYAVFDGQSFKEMAARYQKGEEPEDGGQYIYVFDLEGNPVRKYILNRYIYGIDVNEEEGIITATDVNHDEPILQFRI